MTAKAYKNAGVDVVAGEALVRSIAPAVDRTKRPGVMGSIGGFGGLFDLKAAGFSDPILVAATDGVGTKLKLALEAGQLGGIGVDLVAMCVNDLVCQGATPLFFLDYYATSRLEVETAQAVIEGIALGCEQAGCALIGGETAEMPGLYAPGDFDVAGFAVGAGERGSLLPRDNVESGDVILGLSSNGLHSNGFSLVRKILAERSHGGSQPAPFDPSQSLAESLLQPTAIYVDPALALHRTGLVKAFAHITGGGLTENIPRALPNGLGAALDASSWNCPPVFSWLAQEGSLTEADMVETFNCGIGMVAIAAPSNAGELQDLLSELGIHAPVIGTVVDDAAKLVTVANAGRLIR